MNVFGLPGGEIAVIEAGFQGPPGAPTLTGIGPPTVAPASPGSFYFDTTAATLYIYANNSWYMLLTTLTPIFSTGLKTGHVIGPGLLFTYA